MLFVFLLPLMLVNKDYQSYTSLHSLLNSSEASSIVSLIILHLTTLPAQLCKATCEYATCDYVTCDYVICNYVTCEYWVHYLWLCYLITEKMLPGDRETVRGLALPQHSRRWQVVLDTTPRIHHWHILGIFCAVPTDRSWQAPPSLPHESMPMLQKTCTQQQTCPVSNN